MKHQFDFWHKIQKLFIPLLRTPAAYNSEVINMRSIEEVGIVVQLGAIVAGGTINIKLQDSPDGSTDWQDVPKHIGSGIVEAIEIEDDQDDELKLGRIDGKLWRARRNFMRVVATVADENATFSMAFVGVAVKEYPVALEETPLLFDHTTQHDLIT